MIKTPGYIAVHPDTGQLMRDAYRAVLMFRDRGDAEACIASDGAWLNYQPVPLVRYVRPRTRKTAAEVPSFAAFEDLGAEGQIAHLGHEHGYHDPAGWRPYNRAHSHHGAHRPQAGPAKVPHAHREPTS
jgi:hypothetical protein